MRRQPFTLVEIMIVVAIIGLIAAIAIPSFVNARNTTRKNACINNLRQISGAQEQAMLNNDTDAPTAAQVQAYLKQPAPTCPSNNAPYELNTIPPACPAGIADHSLP
ncbi:MAG: type II secretion system protein [Lentisphaeria bacterium]